MWAVLPLCPAAIYRPGRRSDAGAPGWDRLHRAFSLIELLVVISIVAVLAAMLLPAMATMKAAAGNAMCGSQQRQLAAAVLVYAQDYAGILPCGTLSPPSSTTLSAQVYQDYYWAHQIGDLLEQPWTYFDASRQPKLFRCPTQKRFIYPGFQVSYVMTYYASHPEIAHAYVNYLWADVGRYARSGNALLGEVRSDELGWNNAGILDFKRLDFPDVTVDSGWPAAFARHREHFNAAYLDGHVQPVSLATYYVDFIAARKGF